MIADPEIQGRLIRAFAFLAGAEGVADRGVEGGVDGGLAESFFRSAVLVRLPAGAPIARQGEGCARLALVLAGSARVYRLGESGREITLYRIGPGQSCVLTASCILGRGTFPAFAECETEVTAALVEQREVGHWLREHQAWRDFVFGLVGERLMETIELLDAVLFQRLEQRLARRLLGLAQGDRAGGISITHQSLAADLGSSREVVSRLLAALEDRGLLRVGRGRVELLDQARLRSMAGGHSGLR